MLAAGMGLVTFGYTMLYVGINRFRGNKISILDALGVQGGTSTNVNPATPQDVTPVPGGISRTPPA